MRVAGIPTERDDPALEAAEDLLRHGQAYWKYPLSESAGESGCSVKAEIRTDATAGADYDAGRVRVCAAVDCGAVARRRGAGGQR